MGLICHHNAASRNLLYRMTNTPPQKLRLLVAPLDWGLGHATRCIPLIHSLLQAQHTVVLAASGPQKLLLQQAFPQLTCLALPGYGIRYSTKGLVWGLLAQIPKLLKAMAHERRWLAQAVATHQLQVVISDNRYGLHHPTVPCVLVTHQLQLALPTGFGFAQGLVRRLLYRHINRFTACWVPDYAATATHSLSGMLGHPAKPPRLPVHYLGWLSRFTPAPRPATPQYAAIIVLSGPEPQRTQFENLLLPQLRQSTQPMLLVRGLPGSSQPLPQLPPHIQAHNHLGTGQLQAAFLNSQVLVSRSGYSTVMDAFTLGMRCIFVPTPGQTEQLYLAAHLARQQFCLCSQQQHFHLAQALATLQQRRIAPPAPPPGPPLHLVASALLAQLPAPKHP
ncbi:MAG: glycosyl transferase family 28 [Bacteroidetes bacterium]|nr:MAG: glycosyl transferase family 28 [Bacteroidota bacterium]